ncbi:tRNA 2-thiouridine(34) synthase MnmA [Cloacibacillus sp. An23]|nr:tRNA 2-thiouridine(34) synthase MnmA [Cloacibacillus sp. An23]
MSGGVDSSVAAFLIKDGGDECAGAIMRLLAHSAEEEAAREVAARLGIPFHVFPLEAEFRENVIRPFIESYRAGLTPNPCVECNKTMKFGKFLELAQNLGMSHIATGHYAVVENDAASGRRLLRKGADEKKDQSYVLWTLTQEQLSRTLLPLGALGKEETRAIAEAQGFANAHKKESQDICFVPDGDYAAFIRETTGRADVPGKFIDGAGRAIGEHKGLIRYTIGQRRGLGLSLREPLYVRAKDARNNTVTLCRESGLYAKTLTASRANLIAVPEIPRPMRVRAKTRYRQPEQPATVEQISENKIRIEFDEPQRAITPGQSVVFYDGDYVVGGGVID